MRARHLALLLALALPAAVAGCQEPDDPPNPEVAPGAPAAPEPGMTTGQVPEAIDQAPLEAGPEHGTVTDTVAREPTP